MHSHYVDQVGLKLMDSSDPPGLSFPNSWDHRACNIIWLFGIVFLLGLLMLCKWTVPLFSYLILLMTCCYPLKVSVIRYAQPEMSVFAVPIMVPRAFQSVSPSCTFLKWLCNILKKFECKGQWGAGESISERRSPSCSHLGRNGLAPFPLSLTQQRLIHNQAQYAATQLLGTENARPAEIPSPKKWYLRTV